MQFIRLPQHNDNIINGSNIEEFVFEEGVIPATETNPETSVTRIHMITKLPTSPGMGTFGYYFNIRTEEKNKVLTEIGKVLSTDSPLAVLDLSDFDITSE